MGSMQLNIASLPGPETIARRAFPNGAVGLAWENFSSPSVVIHGWVWAGSVSEPVSKAGLAGLTASMLTHGTARRSFEQIGEEIESLGAALSIGSSEHATSFTAKCLAEDLGEVLDILTDCLFHPRFPPEYLEKRRGEILTAIRQREHNTHLMASLKLHEAMFPDHPYGRSRLGYRHTIEQLTRQDVAGFYRDHYGAQGMKVVVVGAIEREKALDKLEQAMGHWHGSLPDVPALPDVPSIDACRREYTPIAGKSQSDIVLGWTGMKRQDPSFLQAYLANSILGQFGMMGRIGERVRDEQGLAYYAYTSLDAGWEAGPWTASAGVAPENVDLAVEAVLEEIARLRREPVSETELTDNKAHLIGSLPLRLESKESMAIRIIHMELYSLGLDYLQRLPGLIDALTADDVIAVAQQYLDPDAYVLSVAGPCQEEEI